MNPFFAHCWKKVQGKKVKTLRKLEQLLQAASWKTASFSHFDGRGEGKEHQQSMEMDSCPQAIQSKWKGSKGVAKTTKILSIALKFTNHMISLDPHQHPMKK